MLGQDRDTPSDEMWGELKDRARVLIDKLESGDIQGASSTIEELNEARDRGFYHEVGRLTRGLHDAIVNFEIETQEGDAEPGTEEQGSKMSNAQDRLDYVIKLTQSSADKTMDMVEEGIPLATDIGSRATALREDWGRLKRREMPPEEFRNLYENIDQYLESTSAGADQLNEKLNNILMAQDFQDLTGQVIQKVITLVQDVEVRLVDLMRMAGQVEELTGIVRGAEVSQAEVSGLDSSPEGPQINADKRDDVVSGQDEVDDLLSSLGF